ncbi:hypothetical protein NKF26_09155 [Haladaptatus sp. AB618]|uniref:hypothetical protein n=1 Tax=Haladaptatus sp. AB618 TaxID=2934173 RepID=UPI00209C3347|nr:hypothetical protein [Haladaptatus sp. AB618]MCO8253966.1 hypothetical protein [Haladaptatus sp. AB618]
MGYTIRTIRTARDALVNEVLVNAVNEWLVGACLRRWRTPVRPREVFVSLRTNGSSELVSDGGLKGAARSRTAWSSRRPLSEEFS